MMLPKWSKLDRLDDGFKVEASENPWTVMKSSIVIYFKNIVGIASVTFVAVLPIYFMRRFAESSSPADVMPESFFSIDILFLLDFVLQVACASFLIPAIVFITHSYLAKGAPPSIFASLRWGGIKWMKVFACYIISYVVTATGFLLLIYPGFILMIRLAFVTTIASVDSLTLANTFKSSWTLSKDKKRYIFNAVFGQFGIIIIPMLAIGAIVYAILGSESEVYMFLKEFIPRLFIGVLIITIYQVYLQLSFEEKPSNENELTE